MWLGITYIIFFVLKCSLGKNLDQQTYSQKSFTNFIREMGYPVEVHHVTTPDGYILTMHRIPRNSNSKQKPVKQRPPLLLVHGFSGGGGMFIVPIPEIDKGLAYLLSDAEYDIWILHNRGSQLSMKHTKLTTNDVKYWNFSIHEVGLYDVTSSIDYIIESTGAKKIHYCGASQGSNVFLIALSMKPEYNEKIASAYLMVPVGSVKHTRGLIKYLIESSLLEALADIFRNINIPYYPPMRILLKHLTLELCKHKGLVLLYQHSMELFIGPFSHDLKLCDLLLFAINYYMDNIISKQVQHYNDIFKNKNFQQFDYGKLENQKRYKSENPPAYNLSQITVPVTLMSGKYDYLATEQDILVVKSKLKNVRHIEVMGNHIEPFVSPDLLKIIKDDMVKFFSDNYV